MNYKVGDLVHNPKYPFWGLGILLENRSGYVRVMWSDGEEDWLNGWDLEVL
jgi:hypothetical protein